MLSEIKKDLENVRGTKNKIRVIKHQESLEFEDIHTDKGFKKSILGHE